MLRTCVVYLSARKSAQPHCDVAPTSDQVAALTHLQRMMSFMIIVIDSHAVCLVRHVSLALLLRGRAADMQRTYPAVTLTVLQETD